MGTEILKSFGVLQSELEQARNSLKGVDESIKRLIGRDPSDVPSRPLAKRVLPEERQRTSRIVRIGKPESEEPPSKRRAGVSVFKRLSDRVDHRYKDELPNRQMISKVIVTPKEVPSRQEALAAQSQDEKAKARNRRMFGALLGTLQKFQQEETKLKEREEKRAQLEKKIEEHEIKEKEEIKKERQELFLNRKKKQAEIKMIELKMMKMKDYALWEERQKPRMNFIRTKTKPHIHYLPRRMNDATKALLESSKAEIQKLIEDKKQQVKEDLERIEERMKRNFEHKLLKKEEKSENHEDHDEEDEDEEEDRHSIKEDSVKTDTIEEKVSKDSENQSFKAAAEEEKSNGVISTNNQENESKEGENITENNPIDWNENSNASLLSWGDATMRTEPDDVPSESNINLTVTSVDNTVSTEFPGNESVTEISKSVEQIRDQNNV